MSSMYCPRDRTLLYPLNEGIPGETDRWRCKEGHVWEWVNYNHVHGYWNLQEVGFTPAPHIPAARRTVLGTEAPR
jgi:hypothetical protein